LSWRNKDWRDEKGPPQVLPVIEPLKSLLEKLRAQSADGFILQNAAGKPLIIDSLNVRVIAPAMKKPRLIGADTIRSPWYQFAGDGFRAKTRSRARACFATARP
jgi:hypothetical protein